MIVIKTEFYLREIRKHYPDLAIDTAILNQDGQYNDIVVVNDALIFRFAKVTESVETLRKEIVILKSLQGQISLAVPNPTYNNAETNVVGEAFIGYPMIPGKPFLFHDFKATNIKARERIANQLSRFLYELHHISAHSVIPTELPFCDTHDEWKNMYERIQAQLFRYMRPDACREVTKQLEDFTENANLYKFEPALRHGDFGAENIIYDPDGQSVVGILDFGGAGLGDPAIDFAGLFASYGEEFYKQCCSFYPEMEQAMIRVQFYCKTFALEEALFGIENGNQVAFENGIAKFV
jgi:aminoglycoside 2''-phosphotransferase